MKCQNHTGVKMSEEKKKFEITRNKGFHITFENGWTVSVQFGFADYSDNYNGSMEDFNKEVAQKSNTAEVWSWHGEEKYPENPLGYLSPEEVFEFMRKVKRKHLIKSRKSKNDKTKD